MQTNKEAEQVTLSDLGICCGKMFQEPSPAELPKARTSVSSSKRSSELSAVPFMSLDLTPGHGNLLGESYWELISPWLGGAWMLNTGVSPNDARGSSLSQILQDAPPIKYYLSPKACLGILRRASERGKALPPKLERALKIQAGLMCPDGQPTDLNAFHINQRDEGIDLHGVSGALMATTNMQMQTFVTQPDDTVEGFDGYNGDLTGDVAATLGANCGMSTGRNGVMAFAANQRDEVRDLHDVAGALNAQPGMKQQTFVAAAFSAGAGASAGSIGYAAFYPLTYHVAFQFAEHAHHFEHSFCHGVKFFRTVHNKAAQNQLDFSILCQFDDVAKLLCAAGNAADLRCQNTVSGLDNVQQLRQFRTVGFHAALVFQIDGLVSSALLFQFPHLSVYILLLLVCGASCIAVNHTAYHPIFMMEIL